MTQPLSISSQLAGNPSREPTYSLRVKSASAGEVLLADPRATRALVALMDMNAVLGGAASHYGGPAAFAELMSALHGYVFSQSQKANKKWHEMFHIINDAGHCENGLYALKANYGYANLDLNKLKKFRSIESALSGHGEAHLFPEGVLVSNGPLGSAFPQAQGLAMADALAGKKRVTVTAISDGACMEGEARESLAAIPGFAKQGKLAPFVLVISDNNTKLSGRIDKESFSMAPTFASLSSLGWKTVYLEHGNDLQKCYDVISAVIQEATQNPLIPIAIHAKTIKGIGTKKTAESSSGGHGFPLKSPSELPEFLKEIYNGENYPHEFNSWIEELIVWEKQILSQKKSGGAQEEKIQTGISAAMIKCRKAGAPIVSITSDLPGSTGVAGFRKEFPADSLDIGIAESNMISVAAGFSNSGYVPVVDTFAQFGVTKGALPLTMASLSLAPVICIFSHTGFQDAADGASHQALSYLAMTMSIPNLKVYCLTCSEEAEALLTQAIEKFVADRKAGRAPVTSVFFLGRENFPKSYKPGLSYQLDKAQVISEELSGSDKAVTILASGSMMPQAILASQNLKNKGWGSIVVNPSIHSHLDMNTISSALKKTNNKVVVVEDHQQIGGLAQMLAMSAVQMNIMITLRSLAVHSEFGQSAYNAIDLYRKHKIDADSIVEAVLQL